MKREATNQFPPSAIGVAVLLLISLLGTTLHVSTVLESPVLSGPYMGTGAWQRVVEFLGGEIQVRGDSLSGLVPLMPIFMGTHTFIAMAIFVCAWRIRQQSELVWIDALLESGAVVTSWCLWPAVWAALWMVALLTGWESGIRLLAGIEPISLAFVVGGIAHAVLFPANMKPDTGSKQVSASPTVSRGPALALSGMIAAYVVIFFWMNWGLWSSLRLPHGDSAMYEEHLWNFTHGKGFRSYLDQGLFLGEHIQFVHLFLIPVYLVWPSHLLLEGCESLALALTIIPIYRMTLRHTNSRAAGYLLSGAFLCWFGVHYIDIAIDLKTFRPIAFGIPLMMWWLDALETKRWKTSLVLLLLLLSCKEDFAIVTAPVGLWLAVTGWRSPNAENDRRFRMVFGLAHAALLTVYLVLVVKLFIPWFRDWKTVHYTAYFNEFGNTPQEIVLNMLQHPVSTTGKIFGASGIVYLLCMLLPLGLLPLRSAGRLLTGFPLFLTLCLNQLVKDMPGPYHHFHAPLIPILFWAAATGLGTQSKRWDALRTRIWNFVWRTNVPATAPSPVSLSRFALFCSVTTAVVFSMSPVGLRFWDSSRIHYWKDLYVPGERAVQFEKIAPQIRPSDRVASTDFVHPRFTHCERSYDYSDYPRAVANYEDRVPDDTTVIVLDTQHPYSRIRRIDDPEYPIRELVNEPDEWEIVPDETNGYFIVLRRKSAKAE
ncbi:MAG: DUF2079 domain-containing protein [Planctomycetaceae bacterium]|nr:DUF2079 domain-containing protein [Planctomycetaceae bacterium]MCB9951692.1 DUF2079 domain-containing protein [Planctomycetaceae bacterium]